jgi:hypothetical protein
MIGDNMAVVVSGGVALIYPVINGVPSPDSFSLRTQLIMTVERLRDSNFPGNPNRECIYAKKGDPLATTGEGETFGEILGYIDITEFDCYLDNYTVNYGLGRLVDTVRVTFSQNGSSLHHVAYFEISNADFVKKRYNDTTYTHGKVYEVKYTYALVARPVIHFDPDTHVQLTNRRLTHFLSLCDFYLQQKCLEAIV